MRIAVLANLKHNAPTWDSMNNLRLITAIEEEFNIKFVMEDIPKMINFKMINEIINRYID
jgi:acyl carrier protein